MVRIHPYPSKQHQHHFRLKKRKKEKKTIPITIQSIKNTNAEKSLENNQDLNSISIDNEQKNGSNIPKTNSISRQSSKTTTPTFNQRKTLLKDSTYIDQNYLNIRENSLVFHNVQMKDRRVNDMDYENNQKKKTNKNKCKQLFNLLYILTVIVIILSVLIISTIFLINAKETDKSTTTLTTTTTTSTTTSTSTTTTTTSTSTTTTKTTTTSTSTTTTTTTTPTPPVATSTLSLFCGCTDFTLSLTSISFSTTGATYQWQASLSGSGVWSNIGSSSSSYSLTMSSQSGTTVYRCIITLPTSPSLIFTSTNVTVSNYMCAASVLTGGCTAQDTINNFILVGESNTQINDLSTGCSAHNYNDRTSASVTLFAGKTYIAFVSTQFSSNEYLGIWIDFDNDLVFESSERVAYALMSGTSNNAISLVIPSLSSSVLTGTHRMRATLLYNTNPPNPCGPPAIYGETHDYSVNIIPYASGNVTYSQSFTSGATPSSQCTAWTTFNSLLPLRAYTSLNIRGSFSTTGVTLTDPTATYNIVYALRTSSAYGPATYNSRSWAVGVCGSGYELSANGAVCACTTGYDVRPCRGNLNWGGVNGATCSASTQTIKVTYYY